MDYIVNNIISYNRQSTCQFTMPDFAIIGYTIPKGMKVIASFRAVHLNPEHFKDARTFNPWRWQVHD